MAMLTLLDSISLHGDGEKPNEDALGHCDSAAFVIDGATGLGANIITGDIGTDAAWLAEFCRVHFLEMLADGETMREIVAKTNALVGHLIDYLSGSNTVPRWQLPVASFEMIRLSNGDLTVCGLGDCTAFIKTPSGSVETISPMAIYTAEEIERAKQAIISTGGLTPQNNALSDEAVLHVERTLRASYNTAGGPLWTLGTNPEAAHHLHEKTVPAPTGTIALLCSDGFAALVDKYQRYTAAQLIDTATTQGLAALATQLRHIEHIEDPDAHTYPRFKVSDDATAVLVAVS